MNGSLGYEKSSRGPQPRDGERLYVFVGFGTPAPGTTIQSVVSRLHFHASSKRNLHKWKWEKHPHDSIGHFWSFLLLVNLAHLISNSTDIHEWKLLGVFLKVGSIRYTLEGSNINISIQIRCFERASLAKTISDPGGQKTILLFLCVWSLLASTGTVNEGLRMETFGCFFFKGIPLRVYKVYPWGV